MLGKEGVDTLGTICCFLQALYRLSRGKGRCCDGHDMGQWKGYFSISKFYSGGFVDGTHLALGNEIQRDYAS